MDKRMTWEEVYDLWEVASMYFDEEIDRPIDVQMVPVDMKKWNCDICGYDWVTGHIAESRVKTIKRSIAEFLISEPTSLKGTMFTAELLNDSKFDSKEDRAAVWIAATAHEMCGYNRDISGICHDFENAAFSHLFKKRDWLWHHAMRRLVPECYVAPFLSALKEGTSPQKIMKLIATNIILLKQTHKLLYYTSYEDKWPEGTKAINSKETA